MDPRFKDHEDAMKAFNLIKDEAQKLNMNITQTAPKPKHGLAFIFSARKETIPLTKEELVDRELSAYMSLPAIHVGENPLLWWKSNETRFPNLALLAKKYLSAQGTSVPSKRMFSRGGLIVKDSRTSLTSEHIE